VPASAGDPTVASNVPRGTCLVDSFLPTMRMQGRRAKCVLTGLPVAGAGCRSPGAHSHTLQRRALAHPSSGWAHPHPMSDHSLSFMNHETVPVVYLPAVLDGKLHPEPRMVLSDWKQGQSVLCITTPGRSRTLTKPSVRFLTPATGAPEQQWENCRQAPPPRAPRTHPYPNNATVGELGVPSCLKHDVIPLKVTGINSKNISIQPATPAGRHSEGGKRLWFFCVCILVDMCVCVCVCVRACTVYMHVCMYVCIDTHTHTHTHTP
jgi:hypothetical protein